MAGNDWTQQAACREVGTEVFFPDSKSKTFSADVEEARAVCLRCPVRDECLAEALHYEGTDQRDLRGGIWGGLTTPERAALARNRTAAAA